LTGRCLIQYQSLCLYSANIGISVYNEFKILAESLGKKRKNWQLLFSCIFKFGRKEHLFFFNIINKLKVL